MKVYLAGAIRDGNAYDISWRELAAEAFSEAGAVVLNPLVGQHEVGPGKWMFNGIPATPRTMVPRDLYLLRQADLVFANLLPLDSGYRSFGTIMELGVALERGQLVVLAGDPLHTGHPFLAAAAYAAFPKLSEAIEWAALEIGSLKG